MNYVDVAVIRQVFKDDKLLTYSCENVPAVGQIVRIELGKRKALGVVIKKTTKPNFPIKPIISVVHGEKLPTQLIDLARWLSAYYATPTATVLGVILPRAIGTNHRQTKLKPHEKTTRTQFSRYQPTAKQTEAIKSIVDSPHLTTLLRGETGAGKTLIYRELVKKQLASGRSSMILVPEIALTPQLISDFSDISEHIFVTHSQLTEREKHIVWLQILQQNAPILVLGPRSAVFSPINNLGLIIVDEEHESSYKNDSSPRYDTIRLASKLSQIHRAKLVLGSATPRVSDYYLAKTKNASVIDIPTFQRATKPPNVFVINLANRSQFSRSRILSDSLLSSIERNLSNNRQSLLFHNRRGSASAVLCQNCGWIAKCPNCFIPLTVHGDNHKLQCHQCFYQSRIVTKCPECGKTDLLFRGIGTKQVESEIAKLFPGARLARFDSDTPRVIALKNRYQEVYEGKIDIIIGTQGIAKGLDLPRLDTVGVVVADTSLTLPDFTTTERTFQLLYQVSGRVGRLRGGGQVYIQTYNPEHPAIKLASARKYYDFYKYELTQRKIGAYPPFTHLLSLVNNYGTRQRARLAMQRLREGITTDFAPDTILGPAPAFYERRSKKYRWQLVVKHHDRKLLVEIASKYRTPKLHIDLDPSTLLT